MSLYGHQHTNQQCYLTYIIQRLTIRAISKPPPSFWGNCLVSLELDATVKESLTAGPFTAAMIGFSAAANPRQRSSK